MTKKKFSLKSVLSMLLVVSMMITLIPPAFAAQSNDYVDPADNWLTANGRTNELDVNATTTYETQYCAVCDKDTTTLTYRVPEYTKSGGTALNRGVRFSDGTTIDGDRTGNLDDGTPGVDAQYTGYHWTKAVCQICGTINSTEGPEYYSFNKNVYALNSCDHNFFLDFDNTTFTAYNSQYHTTLLKKGQYCKFCKGTFARATTKQELHGFTETVDAQLGNSRFYVSEVCAACDYRTNDYVTAKSVVSAYYGTEDGDAHTLTVSDLSDSGVKTSIRYGTSAANCNSTSAPNYTKAGYYTVYYKITYSYSGESMTENGVSYVWLLADHSDKDNANETPHVHDYRYIETVKPSCADLGYERWQCSGCGALQKMNYAPAIGHAYKEIIIREATCKQGGFKLHLCNKCGDFYEETTPIGIHDYEVTPHNPTCKSVGYKEHICKICGDNYITDITPLISHSYEKITKEPTCADKGYTTYICTMCKESHVSDYTKPTGHEWDEGHTVTNPGCDSEGVTEFHCLNCNEKMIKAESATGHTPGTAETCTEPQLCEKCGTVLEMPLGHSYKSEITTPTCTAMGVTTYTCERCNDSYTADYTDKIAHDYAESVSTPTCTAMGYTTFTCKNCDDEYISDYSDKLRHNYTTEITSPTCTQMGFTVYTCEVCGESHTSDYTDKTEHNYSKQVIPPTCTDHGYTIYKCPDCGKEFIGDYTDCETHRYVETVTAPTCTEMGYTTFACSECGDSYKAEYTNALGHTPSEWIIDTPATIEHGGEKHIGCLVCGEILQTADIAQLIDKDNSDEDGKAQIGDYSVILTDKDGNPIFNGEITIDINDKISIKLPDGRLLNYADQTTITVFRTETQAPVKDINIFIEDKNKNNATGITDENGQLKAPASSSSTGDNNGTIGGGDEDNKNTFVVTVTDKTNVVIPNCDIEIGESNNIVVKLPAGLILTQDSPAIITVTDQNGNAQQGITVIVIGDKDYIEKGVTDIYGKVTVPPVNSGYTDDNGKVNVQEFNVIVNDESKQIENAFVTLNEDNTISVLLPETSLIDYANRITVTVLNKDGEAVQNMSVTVSDISENSKSGVTDETGKLTVPPLSEDMTDINGRAKVSGYDIVVTDEVSPIENAFIIFDSANTEIVVALPAEKLIEYTNRITVTVTKDSEPVKDMAVVVTDIAEHSEKDLTDENGKATVPPINIDYTDMNGTAQVNDLIVIVNNETGFIEKALVTLNITQSEPDENGETTEIKSISVNLPENVLIDYANRVTVTVLNKADNLPVKDMAITVSDSTEKTGSGNTDKNGKIVVPPLNEDITDDNGNGDITDNEENKITNYTVVVNDTKAVIPNAHIKTDGGKIYVVLPDTHTLTTSNQTTVTVTDKDSKPVSNISVTVTDKNNSAATKSTNTNGQITVPVKSSGGGSSGGSSGGGGGGSSYYSSVNVKVVDKDGKTVSVTKSVDSKGIVTLTLPTGTILDGSNYYTITVTDRNGKAKADTNVILKDRKDGKADGVTDKNGILILPETEHKAYIVGYPDGRFIPDGDMTRAEAAAIFARLISETKGEKISGTKTGFTDVSKNEWYLSYISYLEKYNIIKGYSDNTFKPDVPVTRAEFVAMTVRFYSLFNEVKTSGYTVKYTDVHSSYWAYNDIAYAKNIGWLNGYADGTFKGDNNITRAEVVTVANHALNRTADESYVNKNTANLNKFTDLKNNSHWAYYEIAEAANDHMAVKNAETETWVK